MLFAGHYATETVGVLALGKLISQQLGIKTVFIDIPTGL
jgi:putative NIF3 family GTP cyclohydrolase 1 type 2